MEISQPNSIPAIILAAGASARMGQPKQLLHYRGKTLLRRSAEAAIAAGCAPVIVVLGANRALTEQQLHGLQIRVAENPQWAQGMGSSIRAGMAAIGSGGGVANPPAVLLMLADQPLVNAAALRKLLDASTDTDRTIAAAAYGGTVGAPAVFARSHFPALAALPDGGGAKSILMQHASQVLAIEMPAAATDIDTPQDYAALNES